MVSDETIGTLKSSKSSSPSSSSLPFDLIPEILSRLPVKFLLQLRCVCKSWKYLISSDRKFAKKHLTLSTKRTLHCASYSDSVHYLLKTYSLDDSVLTNITQTQFPSSNYSVFFVGSCDGILCRVIDGEDLQIDGEDLQGVDFHIIQLWNPSIRKFKELPSTNHPQDYCALYYGFGFDLISHNYKVVVVFSNCDEYNDFFGEKEVKVHTLGTDSWRTVSKFPFDTVSGYPSGKHVSGTINWLVSTRMINRVIVSFDLGNECFQEVLLPDDFGEVDKNTFHLCVFRDCLCIIFGDDVWVMKEYGNKKSWTKLFNISCMREPFVSFYLYIQAICVFDDKQVLLTYQGDKQRWKYISYNRKNGTSKLIEFNFDIPEVCVESLISPYF